MHVRSGIRQLALSICQSVRCQSIAQKKNKNTSNQLAKLFLDFLLNENNQRKLNRMFLYLIQVKVVLFAIIFSYFLIIGLLAPPLQISHDS